MAISSPRSSPGHSSLRSAEQITASLERSIARVAVLRLRPRGAARRLAKTMDGERIPGAASFYELTGAGLGLLLDAVRGRALGMPREELAEAFEIAGELLEFAVVGDVVTTRRDRGLYTMLAAAAYHLGGFAARAYSLIGATSRFDALNPSSLERAVTRLIIRDVAALRGELVQAIADTDTVDKETAARILEQDADGDDIRIDDDDQVSGRGIDLDPVLALLLKRQFHRALATFDLGLMTGRAALVTEATEMLAVGLEVAETNNQVTIWWSYLVTRQLIADLWSDSLHIQLPGLPVDGTGAAAWTELRERFIAVLACRERPVHELWPSQRTAVQRVLDATDDLVVSLPTSAGKTRVAEVAALRTIAAGKRVVLVTPLRALSAQMEEDFEDLFGALGKGVSSLYGAAGVLYGDLDALRSADIVITTPEKLDAALRVDAGMLDDVGLIVLDEGHMVGFDARGLRYETLIQRLLNRPDAALRQLLCLSAVFPSGPAFDDFVAWVRRGAVGGPLSSPWRPTRQRFAQVAWNSSKKAARLVYEDNDQAWVDPILTGIRTGSRANSRVFPNDQGELTIAAAWRFAKGGSVLIYSTQPGYVESLARNAIVALKAGWIEACPHDKAAYALARAIGHEWLGKSHVAVEALEHGFVIHHGDLPQPFRRAVEALLRLRKAPVAIASPTLAQGVNLAASTVLFHAINRGTGNIEAREFANVAGRAGRAFVDIEGLVVRPMFEPRRQGRAWRELLSKLHERSLTSGLADAVALLIAVIAPPKAADLDQFIEYLANADKSWEASDDTDLEAVLEHVDHALISLVEPLDADESQIPILIDEALKHSLFQLSIQRLPEATSAKHKSLLVGRARYIWRRSTAKARVRWRASGLGYAAGHTLDALLPTIGPLLLQAEQAVRDGDLSGAQASIVALARALFGVSPFAPDKLPLSWEACLQGWLAGEPASALLKLYPQAALEIEGLFRYRLVWGLDSVRALALATDPDAFNALQGRASLCVESGMVDERAARLVRWGLASRIAAKVVAQSWTAQDSDRHGFVEWAQTPEAKLLLTDVAWPTAQTHQIVVQFVARFSTERVPTWSRTKLKVTAKWLSAPPLDGAIMRLSPGEQRNTLIMSPDFQWLGVLDPDVRIPGIGRIVATVVGQDAVEVDYIGPEFVGPWSTYDLFYG